MAYNNPGTLQFLVSNSPIDIILPPFTQISVQAAKQTITIPIPTNWCYLWWSFLFKGNGAAVTTAMFQELRVKINGILLMQLSGVQLDFINQYYKFPAASNPGGVNANDLMLIVPFIRQNMRGANQWIDFAGKSFGQATIPDVEWETALNCGVADPTTGTAITQVILEMDLVNTNPGGMTTITASNKAKVLPASAGGPGAMMFWNKTTFNASNSTANQLIGGNGLLYGDINHYHLDSLFFFPPTGTMDNYQFWLNSQEVFQRSQEENFFIGAASACRVPVYATPTIDFCETGFADGVKFIAPQATSARFQFSYTASEGLPIIQRSVGYLG